MRTLGAAFLIWLTFQFSSAAMAAEAASNEKIVAIIEKSSDLGAGTKVLASVSGNEVTVSTYRHKESKDIDNDCKIEATLMAKELMISNDFGLRRVIVHFHEPSLTGKYREVIVSYAEIKAFATGAVKDADFMSSLTLNLIPEPIKAAGQDKGEQTNTSAPNTAAGSASDTTASSTAVASATTSSSNSNNAKANETSNSKSHTAEPKPEAAKKLTYVSRRTGISFEFPPDWTIKDNFPTSGDLFVQMIAPKTKESNIEFGLRRTPRTPLECAQAQRKLFDYDGVRLEECRRIKFGKGGYDGALVILSYPHSSGERYYENHLYFGKPNAIFDVWCWCDVKYYRTVSVAFWDVMNTMSFPNSAAKPAAGGKAAPKAGAKKK